MLKVCPGTNCWVAAKGFCGSENLTDWSGDSFYIYCSSASVMEGGIWAWKPPKVSPLLFAMPTLTCYTYWFASSMYWSSLAIIPPELR